MKGKSKALQFFLSGFLFGVFAVAVFIGGALTDRVAPLSFLDTLIRREPTEVSERLSQRVITEESVVVDVAERVSPAVVTVSITQERSTIDPFFLDPFGFFRFQQEGKTETVEQDIGTGFVVSSDGIIATNKHVVAGNGGSKYKVIMNDDTEYEVKQIWRDPLNDLAILKVEARGLPIVEMGDSDELKVGNFVIAIGTALGEFRHTVTTGVISGLGRGIETGGVMGGYVERLDNVIQTDAAINPGNSGGPLLNSSGQVIGVNVAISSGAQNIGFAIPINVIKESLDTFNSTGQFNRAFLGVRYRMINAETAILNAVPAGAYLVEVIEGGSAGEAGLKPGDIIVKFDGESVVEVEGGLAKMIFSKSVGDSVDLEVWREGKVFEDSILLLGTGE